ncbi:MAG: GRP family sugar transporter [Methanoregula sp.]
MFVPASYALAMVIMLSGMVFWGSWPNTFKLTRNWRMELYYWDYAFGIFLTSIVIGLTVGTFFGPDTFLHNVTAADRSAWLYALAAGCLWNCGNILMMLGVSLVGLAVAFPLAIGFALVVGVIGSYLVMPRGNPVFLGIGVAMIFAAVLLNSLAYHAAAGHREKQMTPKAGLVLCLIAGALFSGFGPLVGKSLSTAIPLSPYGVCLFFTLGALLTTIPMMTHFMRHPVEGKPLTLQHYLAGSKSQHVAGLVGGFIWGLGTTSTFVGANSVGIALAYAIGQANPLIAALWGVFVWHEFKGAPGKAKVLLAFMFLLYVSGLSVLAASFNSR